MSTETQSLDSGDRKPNLVQAANDLDLGREYYLPFTDSMRHHRVCFHESEVFDGRAFCWSKPLAMVRLNVPSRHYRIEIDTAGIRGNQCKFPHQLRWNNHKIPNRSISISGGCIRFDVTPDMFSAHDEQRLTISSRPLKSDKEKRELGMPITSIRLTCCDRSLDGTRAAHSTTIRRLRDTSVGGVRYLLGKQAPRPYLPIWSMQMPHALTSLKPSLPGFQQNDASRTPQDDGVIDNVVVSSVEINSRHGTGLMLQYLFKNFHWLKTICSKEVYGGERVQSACHYDLPAGKLTRPQIYQCVLNWFHGEPPKRAYVVPFFESDLIIAAALKDLFQTKICLHYMDDQNIYAKHISNELMEEALTKADLVLAISPEMRNIYEQHYGHKIYVVPPIVPDDLILRKPSKLNDTGSQQRGILIGNVWDPVWLTRLRETIRDSGYQIDWPCMNPNAMVSDRTLGSLKEELAADGIFLIDALSVEELDYELKRRPFAVMPSGTLEAEEETENISRLSLPSRIPYMISSAHLPIVVLGSQETAAARFVERFGLGHCARYEGSQFKKAVESICKHDSQVAIRERARKLAPTFSAANMENWIWDSLDHSEPIDDRFESTFCTRPGEFAYFVDPPAPQDVHWCQRTLWQTLKRLKKMKFEPVTVIDAGASTGIWSSTSSKVFPNAHYVMIDPLMPHYSQETRDTYYSQINSFQLVEAALSNEPGEAEFFVSDNLCDSSLLKVDESLRPTRRTKVQLRTLDELANENAWSGSTLLKIDVPYAEHLVLAGGKDFIRSNVDAVIVELNLEREHPQAKTYREMLDLMDELGFQLVDETEGWRCPLDGRLEQKDSVFVRRSRLETT